MELIIFGILLASVISIDTTHAFQTMLSEPVFSCTLLGFLLGNPELGVAVGLIFELMYLKVIPAGGATFPEKNMASMAVTVLVIALNNDFPDAVFYIFPFAILLGFFFTYMGMRLTVYHRKVNSRLLDKIEERIKKKSFRNAYLSFLMIRVMLHYIFTMFTAHLLMVSAVYLFTEDFLKMESTLIKKHPLDLWVMVFVAFGLGVLMPALWKKKVKK